MLKVEPAETLVRHGDTVLGTHKLQRSMRSLCGVMRGIQGHYPPEMSLAEDQHAVSELGAGGQHEPLGVAVRSRTLRRDLDHLDTHIREHRIERGRELPRTVADEEPAPHGALAEVHDEVAGLLRGPRPVRVCGDAQDVCR
jgi:hypothetical protein